VENKMMYILESRPAERSAQAAVRVAVAMVKERLITEREALVRIDPAQMTYFTLPVLDFERGGLLILRLWQRCNLWLLRSVSYSHSHCTLFTAANPEDPAVKERLLCQGSGASSGAAVGVLVFSVADALLCQAQRQPCILMLKETSVDEPESLKVL
jgi:phosphoenolpyruvate synthase/pyruvate phosphate dikinase